MKILQAYIEQLLEFESMEAFDRWWKHKLEISGTHMEMISADVMNDGTAIVKIRKAYNNSPMH